MHPKNPSHAALSGEQLFLDMDIDGYLVNVKYPGPG